VALPGAHLSELLIILMEECNEVAQRAAKILRFGVTETQAGQSLTNSDRLSDELGDLLHMVELLQREGVANLPRMLAASARKAEKLRRYMQFPE
jgi:NTP pyrophosphatase (non-canonical NTP hydrolase)